MNQPLAYVHPQAKIARNVVIEPFVTQIKAKLNNAKQTLENDLTIVNDSNSNSNKLISKEHNLADIEELSKGFGSFQGEQKQMGESTDPQKQDVRN